MGFLGLVRARLWLASPGKTIRGKWRLAMGFGSDFELWRLFSPSFSLFQVGFRVVVGSFLVTFFTEKGRKMKGFWRCLLSVIVH